MYLKYSLWFKEECKLDDEGNIVPTISNEYYFTIPSEYMNVFRSNEKVSRMLFENWFNTIFRNATGYNSVEQVCIYTLIEKIRTFLPNPKRRRIGGTKKRRRTKRKRNKRKKNLKKSYKK